MKPIITWYGVLCVVLWLATGLAQAQSEAKPDNGLVSRDRLIQDVREFTHTIETAHPDPYSGGGGRIAYHRRLQKLIRELPENGLAKADFAMRLQRFLAHTRDGHTTLNLSQSSGDRANPGGLPLYLGVVEQQLYVEAVTDEPHLGLIGARVESVEGVTLNELIEREYLRRGHDNVHHALHALSRRGGLYYRDSLVDLVPEWDGGETVSVELKHPSGELRTHVLPVSSEVTYPLPKNSSRIDLPQIPRWLGFHFLGKGKTTAYLWIHNMTTYREMFEYSQSVGGSGWRDWARRVYELIHGEPVPEAIGEVIAGIPSAAEIFAKLLGEMKQAGTRTLIVDLRNNFGGNDLMVQMLLYYLVGFDEMVTVSAQTSTVRKLSPLLASSTQMGLDPGAISYAKAVPLVAEDYDFSLDARFMVPGELHEAAAENYAGMFRQLPSFAAEFGSRHNEALYKPARIYVLAGNATQSSGFDLLTQLRRIGAVIVGVTPSQAGNSFGNIHQFRLTHSGLTGWVSTKHFVGYAGEALTGYALVPQHPLTYATLAASSFDPNAALLLALELERALETDQ
jgi:hypothetical protein